jgi:hypothetical protein
VFENCFTRAATIRKRGNAGCPYEADFRFTGSLGRATGDKIEFFSGLRDEERRIGIARGETPFGPWNVNPEPIVIPSGDGFDRAGVLAPDVRLEGDTVRMWFLGMTPEEDIAIGYTETAWPLWHATA